MGIQKTRGGRELFYARSRIVAAAHAAGVASFDTVWTDLNDPEGLYNESKEIVELGFTGKACIHPGQIPTIHKAFMPEDGGAAQGAARRRGRRGRGTRGQGRHLGRRRKMVDAPIVARSAHLLALAELYGIEREAL